jgi:hypothetical protein
MKTIELHITIVISFMSCSGQMNQDTLMHIHRPIPGVLSGASLSNVCRRCSAIKGE